MPPLVSTKHVALKQRAPLDPSKAIQPPFAGLDSPMVILLLGALAATAAGAWWLFRLRRNMHRDADTEYLILESSVTIEIGDEGIEMEYEDEDNEGRASCETVLNSAPPERLAFEIDKLPLFRVSCKPGNILERRGKKTLKLQPGAGDADMAIIDIKEGRLTVSPFSSKKDPSKLLGEFPAIRRRAPKVIGIDAELTGGIATAPHTLQSIWRPLDTAELPPERT